MIEDGNIAQEVRKLSIVVYGTDICDLLGLKRRMEFQGLEFQGQYT